MLHDSSESVTEGFIITICSPNYMPDKKRVYAYYDGSNFYHLCKINYGIQGIYFHHMSNQLINLSKENLIKIKYFNAPVNQQEAPTLYSRQQKFFAQIRKTPFLELILGRLVRRQINQININCPNCGKQQVEEVKCPTCDAKIDLKKTHKSIEKGTDVGLAIHLLLDALEDKYDVALLFSGDGDFSPAIKYIIRNLGKEIIFCCFPFPRTNELVQCCSDTRLITKDMVEKSQVSNTTS